MKFSQLSPPRVWLVLTIRSKQVEEIESQWREWMFSFFNVYAVHNVGVKDIQDCDLYCET